jgi:hypothetical protein
MLRLDRAIQRKGTGLGACPVLDTGVELENMDSRLRGNEDCVRTYDEKEF